jgi:signal transduction histidine kinase
VDRLRTPAGATSVARTVASNGSPRRRTGGDAAIVALGAVLCGLAAWLTAAGSVAEQAWLEACARALAVAAPIGVGVYARRRPASARFGNLLVATGVAWFATTLSESSDPVLHSIGRIGGWCFEPLLIYTVLAFPAGRLRARADRRLVWASVAIVAALYLPSVLMVERFPEPSPWSTCSAGCPDNALLVLGSEPAFVDDLLRPVREILTVLLFAAVCVRLAQTLLSSSRLLRLTLAPVVAVAILRSAAFAAALLLRRVAPDTGVLQVTMWSLALVLPLLSGAFLLGLARWHLFVATAAQHLAGRLAGHPGPEALQSALAETFDDPQLEILYPSDDGVWVTAAGEVASTPPPDSQRWLTGVYDDGHIIAGIVHDDALADESAFVDAARAYAILTLDNQRLGDEAAALLEEVRESRSRIQAGADDERRRLERDLHDGAQQRLVALRIKLELAAERIDVGDHRSAQVIRALGGEVDAALDEIRSLARGIYPSPLADRGLAEALRSAALQAALPATVLATNTRERYAREVESAAYFCCLEAMQNAAKHAQRARSLVIELTDDGLLQFEVRDDGEGFDPDAVESGVGLTSMRDRLGAVGGDLHIVSSRGRGTRVVGRIPLDRPLPRLAAPRRPGRAARR